MTEEEKVEKQTEAETNQVDETHQDQTEEHPDRLKETTEKIWGSTRHAWSTATFKATQYKKLVQKKIDQSALHKKINAAHAELGKMIDDLREEGKKAIMTQVEVKDILARIDDLKADAIRLEEEIEQIRVEELPQEDGQTEEKPEET